VGTDVVAPAEPVKDLAHEEYRDGSSCGDNVQHGTTAQLHTRARGTKGRSTQSSRQLVAGDYWCLRSGILLSLPCQACGRHGRGPRVCRGVQNGSAAAKGCASQSRPPAPAHAMLRPSLPQPGGGRAGTNPETPASCTPALAAAPSGPAPPTGAQPQACPPPPSRQPRPSTPHRTRCRAPGGADRPWTLLPQHPPTAQAHTQDGNTTWAPKGAPRKWAPPRWPPAAPKQTRLSAAG